MMKLKIEAGALQVTIQESTDSDKIMEQMHFSRKTRYLCYSQKHIYRNQQPLSQKSMLESGDLLTIIPFENDEQIAAWDHPVKILYEDELLLIVNKEAGMLVHSDGNNTNHTLCNCVRHYFDQAKQQVPVHPLHRLDVETSGILLFCKYPLLQPLLDHMMENKEIRRSYLAVVRGCFPQKAQIYTDPIGRDRHDARRMILHPKGKSAWTKAVLLRYCKKKDRSLIRCTLGSGRTHQIRVHLSGHGYPLVNDPLYGGHRGNTIGRMALHSAQVSFYHPLLQQSVEINCPLPDDLEKLMR